MSKLINTPYGRKTPELLCAAMDVYNILPEITRALETLLSSGDLQIATDSNGCISGIARALRLANSVKIV